MEYVYSAMLLHSAGKEITEEAVTNVLKSAGIKPDTARVKALVASLKDVNIDEAIQRAVIAAPVASTPSETEKPKEEKKEEQKEEESKTEEEAAAGLGALFG